MLVFCPTPSVSHSGGTLFNFLQNFSLKAIFREVTPSDSFTFHSPKCSYDFLQPFSRTQTLITATGCRSSTGGYEGLGLASPLESSCNADISQAKCVSEKSIENWIHFELQIHCRGNKREKGYTMLCTVFPVTKFVHTSSDIRPVTQLEEFGIKIEEV